MVQGSCLGPLLFLIFINAIGSIPISGKLFLFADDAVLINVHKSFDPNTIVDVIRQDMIPIVSFFNQRRLSLNVSKTNFMTFSSRNREVALANSIEILAGVDIQRVHSTKYLGLTINENFTWNDHIEKVGKKLAPAAGILWKLKDVLPLHCRKVIYDSLLQSHLNYVTPVWGFSPYSSINRIQIIQNRALRNVYKLPSRTNRVFMYLHLVESHLPIRGICILNTATFMHKSSAGAVHSNINFKSAGNGHSRKLRNTSNLRPLRSNSTYGDQALNVIGPKIYNRVPQAIKSRRFSGCFRSSFRHHLRTDNFITSCFNKSFFDLKF